MTKERIIGIAVVGLVLILSGIFLTVQVMKRESNKDKQVNSNITEKIGEYTNVEVTNYEVAERYFKEIQEMIITSNYDAIDLILDRTNPKYAGLNYQKIKNIIESKNILGKELEFVSYDSMKSNEWNNIYIFNVKVKDEEIYIKITINEESPNVYYIVID